MSQATFTAIIGRAAVDGDFMDKLKGSPDDVFSEYTDLNDEEKEALRGLDAGELDALRASTVATALEAIVNKKDG